MASNDGWVVFGHMRHSYLCPVPMCPLHMFCITTRDLGNLIAIPVTSIHHRPEQAISISFRTRHCGCSSTCLRNRMHKFTSSHADVFSGISFLTRCLLIYIFPLVHIYQDKKLVYNADTTMTITNSFKSVNNMNSANNLFKRCYQTIKCSIIILVKIIKGNLLTITRLAQLPVANA